MARVRMISTRAVMRFSNKIKLIGYMRISVAPEHAEGQMATASQAQITRTPCLRDIPRFIDSADWKPSEVVAEAMPGWVLKRIVRG